MSSSSLISRLAHPRKVLRFAMIEPARLRFAAQQMPDLDSFRRFRRLDSRWRSPAEPESVVRVRALDGAPVALRARTADATALWETFRDNVHVPPPEVVARGIKHGVDLGANIGLTVADNARRFPEARFVAVELDPENTELCRRNVASWADRIDVLQGAVWTQDGEISFAREAFMENAFHVVDGPGVATRALSMDTILSHVPAGERIDWMKMDIEGVEAQLLSGPAAAWAERVDAIGLQVHGDYTLDDCARELSALGFVPRVDTRRPSFIVGVRP